VTNNKVTSTKERVGDTGTLEMDGWEGQEERESQREGEMSCLLSLTKDYRVRGR
jgi:hypothetical protein